MFDHLAKGRFLFGIGPGGLPCDLELFKTLDRQDRMHMEMEAIDLILEIWRSDPPYALKGKYWDIVVEKTVNRELGLGPMVKPYQQPHPPIAIPVLGRNAYGARIAGGPRLRADLRQLRAGGQRGSGLPPVPHASASSQGSA